MDDHKLVQQARGGDLAAYEMLLRRYQPLALRAAYVIVWDENEAEEAVQQAFVNAWRNLERFESGAPFRPWLLRIVANAARDRARSAQRRARLVEHAASAFQPDAALTSPEGALLRDAELERVIEAVNELPELDRLLIAYRYFLDLGTPEIAELLGTPAGTVRSRLSRVIGTLRVRLNTEAVAASTTVGRDAQDV